MNLPYEYRQVINENHIMRVLNKKYWPYHVEVKETSYSVFVKADDAERWCYNNFKSSEWRNVGNYFAFKREQDALLFTLKWK
jgi:hypothetical protein